MKYLSFIRPDGQATIGKQTDTDIIELVAADGSRLTLKAALADNALATLLEGAHFNPDQVQLLPPVPDPDKILCIGLNYASHVKETGRTEGAKYPVVFTRFADTLVAHNAAILQPRHSDKLDYEGELVVIIGKAGRDIPEREAMLHIAGFSCFNDASIRDWQRHASHFTPGKNFPATGGFGPWLVTPDEVPDLEQQHVCTRLNGEVVQDQPISDLIFSVPKLISYLSAFTPLRPGDLIVTGTPGGVGYARTPPLWMHPGDTVEVSIGKIGTLTNTIEAES